jgi:hypothetical protein
MNHPNLNHPQFKIPLPFLSQGIASGLLIGLLSTLSTPVSAHPYLIPVVAQSPSNPTTNAVQTQLQGRWQAEDSRSGEKLTLIFASDGQFFMILPFGEAVPIALPFKYRIDTTPQPMHFDVILPEEKQEVLTIFEFTDAGQLRLQLADTNPGQPRPKDFTPQALVLEKISDETTLPPDVVTPSDLEGMQGESLKEEFERQAQQARESEGKFSVGAMNRTQQAYFLENNKFATSIEDLGVGLQPESDNYRFAIVSVGNTPGSVQITAQSKRPELRSYTGAVFVVKTQEQDPITITGICKTDEPSSTPPAMPPTPKSMTSPIQCPAGSHLIGL